MRAKLFTIMFFLCAAFSTESFSACPKYFRIYGTLNLKKKTWTTSRVTADAETLCDSIPSNPNGNLVISFKKKGETFSQKIYQSLDSHWDVTAENKSFKGGKSALKNVFMNTLIPDWYKGSTFTITDLKTGKTLSETKL